ncbi:MAG: helix-turn-helix domain-containing protein [Planctomycetales bacterium]|nr:helix-turn-helix domain-containing protein [Planctomycetales bacterium]
MSQEKTLEPITLTIGQVADLLQISTLTVRRMWQRGEFVAPVSLGRVIRWRKTDVEDWLKNRATSELYESKAQ